MLLSSSLALQKETDLGPPVEQLQLNARTLERVRGELEDAVFTNAWEKGARLSLDEAIALALEETSS